MEDLQQWAQKVRSLTSVASSGTREQMKVALESYTRELGDASLAEAVMETRDAERQSLVHFAAQNGNIPVVQYLAEIITAAEATKLATRNGQTPLFNAVNGNQPDMVRLLLSWGADRYHMDKALITPIHCALRLPDDSPILGLLTENLEAHENIYKSATVTGSLLTWCVLTNHLPLLKKIIDISPPQKLAEDCARSSLPCAVVASARKDTAGVVLHYLLQKNVAPDTIASAKDQQGCSVLANLAQLDDASILVKLISECTEPCLKQLCSLCCEGGKTPYLLAATAEARAALEPFTADDGKVGESNQETPETRCVSHTDITPAILAECESLKSRANHAFTSKQYETAESLYDEACRLLNVTPESSVDEGLEDHKSLVSTLMANSSVACLRLNKLDKAEALAKAAIQFAPEWYKGYYRLAMVKKALGDYEEATQEMYQCILRNGKEEGLQNEFKACLEKARAQHAAAVAKSSHP